MDEQKYAKWTVEGDKKTKSDIFADTFAKQVQYERKHFINCSFAFRPKRHSTEIRLCGYGLHPKTHAGIC